MRGRSWCNPSFFCMHTPPTRSRDRQSLQPRREQGGPPPPPLCPDTRAAAAAGETMKELVRELEGLRLGASGGVAGDVGRARDRLIRTPQYAQLLEELVATDVEGCVKQAARAAELKAEGNSLYMSGEHQRAVRAYSDALQWLPVAKRPLEAAKLHANRAAALLKLAADGGGGSVGDGDGSAAERPAAAAEEDCDAALALGCAGPGLQGKVLFRRAQARLLLRRHGAAEQDCRAALEAAGASDDTSSRRDVEKLLDEVLAARGPPAVADQGPGQQQQQQQQQQPFQGSAGSSAGGLITGLQSAQLREEPRGAPAAAAPGVASAAPGGEQPREGPASGPSLAELDRLLFSLQQQAWPQQQEQQPLLRCRFSADRGRHVVAAAEIAPGTPLLAELPLAAAPAKRPPGYRPGGVFFRRCGWCFERLSDNLWWTCTACVMAVYCSRACREADARAGSSSGSGHAPGGTECNRPWPLLLSEHALLAARVAAAAAAAAQAAAPSDVGAQTQSRLLGSLQQGAWPREAAAGEPPQGAAHGELMQQVFREQLVTSWLVAGVHQRLAAGRGDGARSAEAVLASLRRLVANGVAVRPLLARGAGDWQAVALYPAVAATINHSCSPNCSIRFDGGRRLLLVCVRGAAAGEELAISYGPQLGEEPTALRRLLLSRQYGFLCSCPSCMQGAEPGSAVALREAAAGGLACCSGRCAGAVPPPERLPPGLVVRCAEADPECQCCGDGGGPSAAVACSSCGWAMPPSLLRQKLGQLSQAAAAAEEAAELMARHEQQLAAAAGGSRPGEPQARGRQQQGLAARAAQLLVAAAGVQQQHLHPLNQLLGETRHQAAVAAAAAAVAAPPGAAPQRPPSLLHQGLLVSTVSSVQRLVRLLQRQLEALAARGTLCACVACGSRACPRGSSGGEALAAASAAAKQPCSCPGRGQKPPAPSLQHLQTAAEQLLGSAATLAAHHPADSLALAAERLLCAAASADLLQRRCEGSSGAAGQPSAACSWCCACSQLLLAARRGCGQARDVFDAHWGGGGSGGSAVMTAPEGRDRGPCPAPLPPHADASHFT